MMEVRDKYWEGCKGPSNSATPFVNRFGISEQDRHQWQPGRSQNL